MRYAYIAIAVLLFVACGFVFWLLRTPRVRIVTLLYSPAESPSEDAAPRAVNETTAEEAAKFIKSDRFMSSVVDNPMIFSSNLAIGSNSPVDWLTSRVQVGFDSEHQVPTVSVVVPAEHEQEGRMLVEGILNKFFNHQLAVTTRAVDDRRSKLEERFQQLSDDFANKSNEVAELTNSDLITPESRKLASEIEAIDQERVAVLDDLQEVDAAFAAPDRIRVITATSVTKLAW